MYENDEGGYAGPHRLSPEQWEGRKQRVIRGAREARAQALRELSGRMAAAVRKLARHGRAAVNALTERGLRTVGRWTHDYARWRERRRAMQELGALDDRALKDFGINRSEIEAIVYGRDLPRVREGRIAAVLLHKPYDRRSARRSPAPTQSINKTAA